jgi:hypothetical protein
LGGEGRLEILTNVYSGNLKVSEQLDLSIDGIILLKMNLKETDLVWMQVLVKILVKSVQKFF